METNNKIIAEFMGVKESQYKNEYEMYSVIECIEDGENEKHFFKPDEMLFNSDWNWLMEVVEKIESIKIETYKVRVDIYFNCCQINPTHWEQLISIYGNKETKIEAVYNACIEFIKWYNENKSHL